MMGVFWALVSGVGFGFFQAFHRRARRGLDTYRGMFLLLLIAALVLTIASLMTENLDLLRMAPSRSLILFALAGLVHFFVGWTLLSVSQQRVGAARTGVLVGATPLFATILAAVTLGEVPRWPALLGIVMVVAGVYIISAS